VRIDVLVKLNRLKSKASQSGRRRKRRNDRLTPTLQVQGGGDRSPSSSLLCLLLGFRVGDCDFDALCLWVGEGRREGGREGGRGDLFDSKKVKLMATISPTLPRSLLPSLPPSLLTLRAEIGHHDIFQHCLDSSRFLGLRKGGRKGVDGGTEGRNGGDEGEVEGVVNVKGEGSRRLLGTGPEGSAGAGDL